MKPTLRIAMRDWDYLTPILLGEITDDRVDLQIVPVYNLPGKQGVRAPAPDTAFDGNEASLSRYVQRRAGGDDTIFGLPVFPMRSFRHRCIITAQAHPARSLTDLKGGRIGVAGWQDSGNTWTRAAMQHAGVAVEDIQWVLGGLEIAGINAAEMERFGGLDHIVAAPDGHTLYDLLAAGALDAVFTPFMPDGFFGTTSPFRPVLDDLPGAELGYFRDVGYVPGIHLITLSSDLVSRHDWLPEAIMSVLDRARAVWLEKRRRYAETTPWIFDDLLRAGRHLPEGWDASGVATNRNMVAAFVSVANAQGLIENEISVDVLFPERVG